MVAPDLVLPVTNQTPGGSWPGDLVCLSAGIERSQA